jgi:WD repeat-containing protein 61
VVGKYASYVRAKDDAEPCECCAAMFRGREHYLKLGIAWSVSLNPKGETYASTGGSGNVTIHSAQPNDFGERLSSLSSGRNKYGMHCSHVRTYSLSFAYPHTRE